MQSDPTDPTAAAAEARPGAPTGSTAAPTAVPAKIKTKPKYSKGLKEIQQLGRAVNKASTRAVRAVAKGMATYRKRSDKSARKKRDGALRDLTVNLAEGLGKTMRELSDVPSDLAKAMNGRRARKRVRKQLDVASRLLRPLR